MSFGGYLWLIIDVIAVAALAAALLYARAQWKSRRRDPATEEAAERATRELYGRERSDSPAFARESEEGRLADPPTHKASAGGSR
jgi:hypothetical protein